MRKKTEVLQRILNWAEDSGHGPFCVPFEEVQRIEADIVRFDTGLRGKRAGYWKRRTGLRS